MDRLISEKFVMEVIYGCDWFIDEEHAEVIKKRIKAIPSAEPKTGHWITCDVLKEVKCSECRMCFRHTTNYCPNCGARMGVKE